MPTDKKTIDAYNKFAEKWANAKRDGSSIFHIYLEKPGIYSKLPDLTGKTVLCIGCGSGEEVEFLSSLGTNKVVGMDISEGLIGIAKNSYPDFEFHVMDMEELNFPEESFDFAFSSLTMHYLLDWKKTLSALHKVLMEDSRFVFSITHPFFSAVERKEDGKIKSRILGFKDFKETNTLEIYGDYFTPMAFDVNLNNALTATNCHRPLSLLIKDIISSGFELVDIVEPRALDESKEEYKKFWEVHQKIPELMIMDLRKK
jgi:SAM-dependent methyltransferase